MAAQTSPLESDIAGKRSEPYRLSYPSRLGFALLTIAIGLSLGAAIGMGLQPNLLVGALLAPCVIVAILARPHVAVIIYIVLVYGDLLSVLVQSHGFPPLARFAGFILLVAVFGYRLIIRQEGLVADRMTWWLAAYGILLAAGLLYARSPGDTMPEVIEFIRNFLAYLVIINTVTTVDRVRKALIGLLALASLLALLSIYQTVTGDFSQDFGGLAIAKVTGITEQISAPRPAGTIGDANYYGQSLLIALPIGFYFAVRGRSSAARLAGVGAVLLLTAAILFTYSRGDMVALAALLVAAIIYKRPRPQFILGGIVALGIIVSVLPPEYYARIGAVLNIFQEDTTTALVADSSLRGRAGAAMAAVAVFMDHPFLGVGRANYPLYELSYIQGTDLAFQSKGIPPHDLYLEVASELGIVGIILFGGIMVIAVRALLETRRRFLAQQRFSDAELATWLGIGLFTYMVASLFLHGAYQFMLWLQIALIIALRNADACRTSGFRVQPGPLPGPQPQV